MTQERRRYYRIDEEVMLALTSIAAGEIDQRLDDFWSDQQILSIRNEFNCQISQHIADRNHIEQKMPALGRYLAVLERQIDLLTERLLVDDDEDQPMQKKSTNLSAQGISFHDAEAPQQNDMLELQLKLLPSGLKLVIIARVVQIEEDSGEDRDRYKISLDFEHLHEADREILIKHIHAKQMENLSNPEKP